MMLQTDLSREELWIGLDGTTKPNALAKNRPRRSTFWMYVGVGAADADEL